jgi:hypothetical protein
MSLALVILALTLSSCARFFPSDPGSGGYTGASIDDSGLPQAHVVMCEGNIDGLWIRFEDPDGHSGTVDRFTTAQPVTSVATVPLGAPGREWTAERQLEPLSAVDTYSLGGWSNDYHWTSVEIDFTKPELERLEPGQILWQTYDIDREAYVKHTSNAAGFSAHACDNR